MSSSPETIQIKRVAVIGAGTMGAQIATLTAFSGRPVRLFDAIPAAMENAKTRIDRQIAPEIDKAAMLPASTEEALSRVSFAASLAEAVDGADLVVEAVREDIDIKRALFAELDRIAVTTGPGSFTGLRVGIAAARGIALAAGKPAVGLTTLAAYAAPLVAADDTLPVVVAIDARHDHVYLQVFGPGGRTIVAPRLAPLREALRVAATGAPRLTGTAAAMLAAAWPAGERAPSLVDARRAPAIDWVARLGAAAPDTGVPPKPLYLRAPDAQPQNAAQLARR